jgi:tRNA(His) 5'-end guanylyltransferase
VDRDNRNLKEKVIVIIGMSDENDEWWYNQLYSICYWNLKIQAE